MPTRNRTVTQARDARIVVGLQSALASVATLPAGGVAYTPASLAALIQRRIDAAHAVAAAKAQWLDAVRAYEAIDATASVAARGLKQYVMNAFGEDSPVLAEFGFTPPVRTTLTPEQKAAAVAKRAATRRARHTMGKKQKAQIHGTVPTIPPAAPVPAPPAATASTAPAPSAAPSPVMWPAPS
jgi:hypothetical protein